jgi:hypothetical protein
MKCKHCGMDSDEETRAGRENRVFREQLELERADPQGYRKRQWEKAQAAIHRGCAFMNYSPGKIAIFEPRGGGSYDKLYGSVADEIAEHWTGGMYKHLFDKTNNPQKGGV